MSREAHPLPDITRQKILRFIEDFWLKGYGPSYRDLRDGLGYSTTSHVRFHIRKLQEEGLVICTPGIARSLRLHTKRGGG